MDGLVPFKKMLKTLGGWPVLEGDKWENAEYTWKDVVYKIREMGYSVDYLIRFSIGIDSKNSTMRAIEVSSFILNTILIHNVITII